VTDSDKHSYSTELILHVKSFVTLGPDLLFSITSYDSYHQRAEMIRVNFKIIKFDKEPAR
jgi:hypothetical protein